MSTPRCPTCKKPYWRYRADFPPRGYCSFPCWLERSRRKTKPAYETAAVVLEAFRDHRKDVHATTDVLTWFDCDVCERFEERYAVSMYL